MPRTFSCNSRLFADRSKRREHTHTHSSCFLQRQIAYYYTTNAHNRLPYIYVHNKNTFSVRQHNSSVSARARARLNQDVSSPVPAFGARPATDGFARTAHHHHHHQSPDDCEQIAHSIYSYFHWMYNSTLDNRNRWCVFGWSGGGYVTFRTAHRAHGFRMYSFCKLYMFAICTALELFAHPRAERRWWWCAWQIHK